LLPVLSLNTSNLHTVRGVTTVMDVYVSLPIENDFPNMKLQTEDKVHNLCS